MKLSATEVAELERLKAEVETLSQQRTITRSDGKKLDAILSQISAIKLRRAQTDEKIEALALEQARAREAHETVFRSFMGGRPNAQVAQEGRAANDLLAGTGAVEFTDGAVGGVFVPMAFQKSVSEGLAAVDPLLDPNVCTVVQENDFRLPPLQLPGWDLSTITATKVGEATQGAPATVPGMTQKLLNKFTYRLSLGASLEWDEDQQTFDSALSAAGRAFGIGFARGIGADCILGAGDGTAPQGVLTGATDSGYTTATAGKIGLGDIDSVYFSVNRIYRQSPKCAWLLSDPVYKMIHNAADNSGRPLLNIEDDRETLLGKPVYVCPSMPSTPGSRGLCFGDLSHYIVHVSTMFIRRRLQAPGYVENGKYLLTGLMMADAVLNDPTAGAMPPVIFATLHA